MNYYKKTFSTIPSFINKFKIKHSNKILIDIPLIIHKYNYENVIFELKRNINLEENNLLWNLNNINDIKIIMSKNNFDLIDNYIYKYHLIYYNDLNIYHLKETNILEHRNFSKTLNSCSFLLNLYKFDKK